MTIFVKKAFAPITITIHNEKDAFLLRRVLEGYIQSKEPYFWQSKPPNAPEEYHLAKSLLDDL